jgi:succinoglycan biosynthesis transport protein ExoP
MTRLIDASVELKRKDLPGTELTIDYRPSVPSLLGRTEMQMLYSAVTTHLPEQRSRVIELASATRKEGTSTIAREMAMTVAGDLSKTVMLVRVVNDLPFSPGLEAVAHGRVPLEAVVEEDPSLPTLATATLSVGGSNAGLLFDGDELDRVFAHAARLARLVIVDAPAVLTDVSAVALSRRVSGVLLVVEAEKTRAPIVQQARRLIEMGGGRVLGAVLNKRRNNIPRWLYRRV